MVQIRVNSKHVEKFPKAWAYVYGRAATMSGWGQSPGDCYDVVPVANEFEARLVIRYMEHGRTDIENPTMVKNILLSLYDGATFCVRDKWAQFAREFAAKEEDEVSAPKDDFNGYANYETWNAALHIGEDQALQTFARTLEPFCGKAEPYAVFVEALAGLGITKTPDGVALNDISIDADEMNDCIRELWPSKR